MTSTSGGESDWLLPACVGALSEPEIDDEFLIFERLFFRNATLSRFKAIERVRRSADVRGTALRGRGSRSRALVVV
jgi:hypothetical protein